MRGKVNNYKYSYVPMVEKSFVCVRSFDSISLRKNGKLVTQIVLFFFLNEFFNFMVAVLYELSSIPPFFLSFEKFNDPEHSSMV